MTAVPEAAEFRSFVRNPPWVLLGESMTMGETIRPHAQVSMFAPSCHFFFIEGNESVSAEC